MDIKTDVCIIGAGVAGITLAKELSFKGVKSVLFDRGPMASDMDGSLNIWSPVDGVLKSMPNYLDKSRMRGPGGSSGHWANYCKQLDEIDLRNEKYGGWPLLHSDLLRYYRRAYDYCKVKPINETLELGVAEKDNLLRIRGKRLRTSLIRSKEKPVNFHDEHGDGLRIHPNCTFIGFVMDGNKCISHANFIVRGSVLKVTAGKYVLACGGVDNAKHLMLQKYQIGWMAENRALGRFFHEHLHINTARVVMPSLGENVRHLYNLHVAKERNGVLCMSEDEIKEHDLLNSHIDIDQYPFDDTFKSMGASEDWFCGRLRIIMEHETSPKSNIQFREKADDFGIKMAKVNLHFTEREWRTLCHLTRLFIEGVDYDRLAVKTGFIDKYKPDYSRMANAIYMYGSHHIGTTRMSTNQDYAVVDKNCKVLGTDNLYCAGSSVFATGGHAAPTLTITALAIRLAEHLGGI